MENFKKPNKALKKANKKYNKMINEQENSIVKDKIEKRKKDLKLKKLEERKEPKCKNCVHWFNKQRETDYSKVYGFCNESEGVDKDWSIHKFKVYVHEPWTNLTNDYLDSDGSIKNFKYEFATHREFGCITFKSKFIKHIDE